MKKRIIIACIMVILFFSGFTHKFEIIFKNSLKEIATQIQTKL